jgi:hypothetical protein
MFVFKDKICFRKPDVTFLLSNQFAIPLLHKYVKRFFMYFTIDYNILLTYCMIWLWHWDGH